MGTLGQAGRVGAMVVVGLVLVFVMYMFLSGLAFRHSYTIDVLFKDATGAGQDAPVTLAGVQIGQVETIHLTADQKADLKLQIKDQYHIPVGAVFSIVTPILGSTGTVVVTPPSRANLVTGKFIQPGTAALVGQQSADISTAFSRADTLMTQLSKTTQRSDRLIDAMTRTTDSANSVIGGRQVQESLDNLDAASRNGVLLSRQLGSTLQGDNTQLLALLRQTSTGSKAALDNIDATTAQVQGLAAQNRGKLNNIVADLQDTTSSLSGITDQINQSMRQGNVPQNLGVVVQNLKTSSDNLVIISSNFAKLSADQGIQGDLRATLHNLRNSTEQSNDLLLRLNQIIGVKSAKEASNVSLATPPGGQPPMRIDHQLIAPLLLPRLNFVQNLREHHFRTDLDAVVPIKGSLPGAFARVGVYGLGDTNRGILEYGAALDPKGLFDARAGLYASKLAVGADVGLGRAATLSLDAWDPNNLHLDTTGVLMLGDGFGLLVGDQDILRHASPTVGLEYRR